MRMVAGHVLVGERRGSRSRREKVAFRSLSLCFLRWAWGETAWLRGADRVSAGRGSDIGCGCETDGGEAPNLGYRAS